MPEYKLLSEVKESEENSEQVDKKTEEVFDLIRSHEEWMKKTQEFLDKNINSLWKVEITKKVLSYPAKRVWELFSEWHESPESIDLTNPDDKKIYSDILLYVKINNPQLVNISLEDMQKAFLELKQKEWERKYKSTRDFRNKNPLSLKIPGKQYKHDWPYVVYSTFDEWWKAAYKMIDNWKNWNSKIYKPTFSLTQVNAKYASDPRWASRVAINLKMPISTKIWQIPTEKLVAAISAVEDGECYKLWVAEGYIPNLPGVK